MYTEAGSIGLIKFPNSTMVMVWPASKSRSMLQPQLLLFLYTTGCFILSMSRPALVDAAAPFSFSFDFSNTSTYRLDDLRFEGDAVLNGDLVDLTCKTPMQAITNNCTGRMSYNQPVRLYDNTTGEVASFFTRFTFAIKPNKDGGVHGDGLAFFISDYPLRLLLSSGGGNLGPDGLKSTLDTNRFIAVEFDTYNNTWDHVGTKDHIHVGININTVRSSANTTRLPSSSQNGTMTATISFDSTTKMLIVCLQYDDLPSVGPVQVSTELPDDVIFLLSSEVAVGFSATTSISFDFHQIMSWSFSSTLATSHKIKVTNGTTETPGVNNLQPKLRRVLAAEDSSADVVATIIAVAILLAPVVLVVWFILSWCMWKRAGKSFAKKAGLRKFYQFKYRDISKATDNFKDKIGEGAFGVVYKGVLKEHKREPEHQVAVKKIKEFNLGNASDFLSELKATSEMNHKNLVKLKGWCYSGIKWKFCDFMFCRQKPKTNVFLVYELVPNGSLHDHLNKDMLEQTVLSWETRYEIVKGIASGLCYLHHDCKPYILHRDIKPQNILLEADFTPKIADFGLSKIANQNNTIPPTRAVGTEGYMDPMCRKDGKVKFGRASDVYSFGIVLLDIACPQMTTEQVREMYRRSGLEKLLEDATDVKLHGAFNRKQMKQVVVLGLWCCFPDDTQRPSMKDAMKVLENDTSLLKKGMQILRHDKELSDEQIIENEGGGNASRMTSPDGQ